MNWIEWTAATKARPKMLGKIKERKKGLPSSLKLEWWLVIKLITSN